MAEKKIEKPIEKMAEKKKPEIEKPEVKEVIAERKATLYHYSKTA